ncbi:hypothetical protein [Streptomyces mexicanus]|uniref:hypothetical protein n=1 Tax=Streptomyces mexicanus TaxID=178566 RepID=UPI0036AF1CB1
MTVTRSKILLATGLVLVLALVAGLAYALELPPFEKDGEVKAADVCTSLGDPSRAVAALKEVLPNEPSYSFEENATDLRTDQTDNSFQTDCFVYGGGKQLLVARTEMLEYDTSNAWVREAVGQFGFASSLQPFTAGDGAVASDKLAAIYVPCATHGSARHLSVVVRLKKQGDAPASGLRSGLIDLARNTAAFAHTKAKCDEASKL